MIFRAAAGATLLVSLSGCATLGYYAQSAQGQFDLMSKRRPIEALLDAEDTPAALREQLAEALALREFASTDLGLPDGGSYRSYADLGRPFAVWTVAATEEFSLQPSTWCFPVAGCVSYRGYFTQAAASDYGGRLRAEGMDVYVGGVRAYSTLGWFDDPVLNSMLGHHRFYLAGVIFHEMAHQQVYADDDSAFNEAYATLVEREGVRRWLTATAGAAERAAYERRLERQDEFLTIVAEARAELAVVYADSRQPAWKRARKAAIIAGLRARHAALEAAWGEASPYARWFAADLNNAKLAMVATYHQRVPAFAALLDRHGGDLVAFHASCEELARLPRDQRDARLRALAAMSRQARNSSAISPSSRSRG